MDGFSKALLVGSIVAGVAFPNHIFAQDKPVLTESMHANFKKDPMSDIYETKGARAIFTYYENGSSITFSVRTMLGDEMTNVTYTEVKGASGSFMAMIVNQKRLDEMVVVSVSGGKIIHHKGVERLQEAEIYYATAICFPVLLMAEAGKRGKIIQKQIPPRQLQKLLDTFRPEYDRMYPVYRDFMNAAPRASPQKYSPKKESEPLYRSANYKEAVLGTAKAMRMRENAPIGELKLHRIRNGAMRRV